MDYDAYEIISGVSLVPYPYMTISSDGLSLLVDSSNSAVYTKIGPNTYATYNMVTRAKLT
jgi:hypothetical protein